MQHLAAFTNKMKSEGLFWAIAMSVYLSLIYPTSVQFVYGPESAFGTYFLTLPRNENSRFDAAYIDRGRFSETELSISGDNLWKLAPFWADAGSYLLQTQSIQQGIPPFKYRVFPTLLIAPLSNWSGWSNARVFVLINLILTIATVTLFTIYLRNLRFNKFLSILGGVLFLTMFPNTNTIAFPMLEPASFFWMMLIFLSVLHRNVPLFLFSSVFGVATKEILVIASMLWLVNWIANDRSIHLPNLFLNGLIASAPLITFMVIRVLLGGSILEVNYGYDVLKGQLPTKYASRLLTLEGLRGLFIGVFLSFSFLWLGLLNIKKNPFLFRNAFLIPVVILATFVLSGGIARVLGILFPVVIPSFLMFFDRFQNT